MSFPTEPPAQRLVTQNLLLSASCALIDPTIDFVKDLATIINLVCLYDDLLLPDTRGIAVDASLLDYLREEKLLRPAILTSEQWSDATKRAEIHLVFASKGLDVAQMEGTLQFANEKNARGQSLEPDRLRDGYLAAEAIKAMSAYDLKRRLYDDEADGRRVVGYALRTFLYLGVADQLGLPLTSDTARKELLNLIARREQDYIRQQIVDLLGASTANDVTLSPTIRAVSAPLAAIVFHRAKSSNDIIPQLHNLRAELKPLRRRLRPWEYKLAHGVGARRNKAFSKVNRSLEELAAKYHLRRQSFTTTDFVQLGSTLAPIAANPYDASVWVPAVAAASGGLLKWQERRFFVELHHEYENIPSATDQAHDLRRLFGL